MNEPAERFARHTPLPKFQAKNPYLRIPHTPVQKKLSDLRRTPTGRTDPCVTGTFVSRYGPVCTTHTASR